MGTNIEWTDETWNPVTGCTKVSAGCDHCYAETFAERFRGVPGHHFEQGFDVVCRPERLDIPLRWTKPRRIFVNSMSDLFHEDVLKFDDGHPAPFIARIFARMVAAPQHTFQILTKRHGVMRALLRAPMFRLDVNAELLRIGHPVMSGGMTDPNFTWPANIWLGVSVENQQWADIRIPALLDTPAAVRFLSCEPLLGPVSLFNRSSLDTGTLVDWVIVGGESGHGARPMHPEWARQLRNECTENRIAFLFKQWGEWAPLKQLPRGDHWSPTPGLTRETTVQGKTVYRAGKHRAGRELDGRTWDEYPAEATA